MKISEYSVSRPVTVLMVTLSVLVLGVISLGRLPLTLLPEFSSSSLTVNVDYPSSSPEEVERTVTRPLEEALSTLNNLEEISSTSSNSGARVRIEFKQGTNMDLVSLDVRDRIDQARTRLPDEIDQITLRRWQSTDMPVIQFSLGWEGSRDELFEFSEQVVQRRLERIDGVANVEVRGIEPRQIIVELDQGLMQAYGIDAFQLRQALASSNTNVSGGYVIEGDKKYTLRTVGEFEAPEDIGELPLQSGRLQLRDIASIRYDYREQTDFSRLDGRESVTVRVFKASAANVVSVCQTVREELAAIQELPQVAGRLTVQVFRDQSEDIEKSLNDLRTAGIYGGLLAMLVLFLFLRKFRSTLIISVAIPVSVLFTFAIMYLLRVLVGVDLTLNVVSLMGLMVAVGMLVDNSVVVLENIFRHKQEKGQSATEAAVRGSHEVGVAVLASTATTVVVFISFIFMQNSHSSRYFRDFGIVVAIALIASLVVALTLIPMVSSRLFTGPERPKQKIIVMMTERYGLIMRRLLRWRFVSLILVALLGYGSYYFFTHTEREFQPRVSERQVEVTVYLEKSFALVEMEAIFSNLEQILLDRKEELEISTISSSYDTGRTRQGRYSGNLNIYLQGGNGELSTESVQARVRDLLPDTPGVEYQFGRRRHWGGGGEMGVEVELSGEDPAILALYAEEVKELLYQIPGIQDVQTTMETGDDEIHVQVDRKKIEKFGVSSTDVARTIASALSTRAVSRYRSESGEIDIILRLAEADRMSLSELENMRLENRQGDMVPLHSIIDYSYEKGPLAIERNNRKATLTVNASTRDGSTFWIQQEAQQLLNHELGLPPGYRAVLGQDWHRMLESEEDSRFAVVMAIILMYIIMASLFESFAHPLTILLTVPFSVIGVAILYYLTNTTLNNMAYLGILILFGIVVNNGIILLDHINLLRREGLDRTEAIITGGKDRLRPIVMTAVTSLIGLLPLSLPALLPEVFGSVEGRARMWAPVSLAVLGGLTTSTFLTLIILPGVYSYMDDLSRGGRWLGRWLSTHLSHQSRKAASNQAKS